MQLGMIGLGKMGANMVRRVMRAGHECVVYDLDPNQVSLMVSEGAVGATSLDDFVERLQKPRTAWVMVPAGRPTAETVAHLGALLQSGDVVIDGGNGFYKDDVRRAGVLRETGVHYLDVGVSGGVWGAERGYCLMIGGEQAAVERLDPIFRALAPGRGEIPPTPGRPQDRGTADQGYLYCGPAGAGHFVKMVHNGIEYGLMQAYAEGFDLLRNAASESRDEDMRYRIPIEDVAEVWRRGSVIGSWLLDLTAQALVEDPALEGYSGFVSDSGEGRWTVQTAVEDAVPAPVITAALFARFRSRLQSTFGDKVLSAMRNKFGGHVEPPSEG
jgi:6-phosphogluconate dehydrogenase